MELGRHRLLRGDATNPNVVKGLLGGDDPSCYVFDPPFDGKAFYDMMPKAEKGKALLLFWDAFRFATAVSAAVQAGWKPKFELILDLVDTAHRPYTPLSRHVGCGVFADGVRFDLCRALLKEDKQRPPRNWRYTKGGITQEFTFPGEYHGLQTITPHRRSSENETEHLQAKPTEWLAAILGGLDMEGKVVLDYFSGSGAVLIACEMVGATYRGLEIDMGHCFSASVRYESFMGRPEAERLSHFRRLTQIKEP